MEGWGWFGRWGNGWKWRFRRSEYFFFYLQYNIKRVVIAIWSAFGLLHWWGKIIPAGHFKRKTLFQMMRQMGGLTGGGEKPDFDLNDEPDSDDGEMPSLE